MYLSSPHIPYSEDIQLVLRSAPHLRLGDYYFVVDTSCTNLELGPGARHTACASDSALRLRLGDYVVVDASCTNVSDLALDLRMSRRGASSHAADLCSSSSLQTSSCRRCCRCVPVCQRQSERERVASTPCCLRVVCLESECCPPRSG